MPLAAIVLFIFSAALGVIVNILSGFALPFCFSFSSNFWFNSRVILFRSSFGKFKLSAVSSKLLRIFLFINVGLIPFSTRTLERFGFLINKSLILVSFVIDIDNTFLVYLKPLDIHRLWKS